MLRRELKQARDAFLDAHDLSWANILTEAMAGDRQAIADWKNHGRAALARLKKEVSE